MKKEKRGPTTDVGLPFYRNFKCLRAASRGIARFVPEAQVWLHAQDPAEAAAALEILDEVGLKAELVSSGPQRDMAAVLDGLFAAGSAAQVLMLEQDTFLMAPPPVLPEDVDVLGPLDTLFIDGRHAREHPQYGEYARLCPRPGYMHSSWMLLNRERVTGTFREGAERDTRGRVCSPFTAPEGTRYWGTGLLGAEPYYGLCERYYRAGQGQRLEFLRQVHGEYGLAAEVRRGNTLLAHHLYYSSTRTGYLADGALTDETTRWLGVEEARFLDFYEGEGRR